MRSFKSFNRRMAALSFFSTPLNLGPILITIPSKPSSGGWRYIRSSISVSTLLLFNTSTVLLHAAYNREPIAVIESTGFVEQNPTKTPCCIGETFGKNVALANLTANLAGGYSVIVSNSAGSATSSVARLPFFGLASCSPATNASPILALGDIPGATYRIDITADLSSTNGWTALTNLTLITSPVLLTDPLGPVTTNRFYRAVLSP